MVLGLVCPDFEQFPGIRHFWRMAVLHAMRCCRLFCLWVATSGPKFTASNVTHCRSRRLIGTRKALNYTYEARCLCSGNFNHADPVRTSSYLYQILGLAPVPSSLPYQKAQDHVLVPRRISYCVTLGQNLSVIIQCKPVAAFWDPFSYPDAVCDDYHPALVVCVVVNTVTDIVTLCLPLPILWRLHASKTQRWQLIGIFSLGGMWVYSC